MRWIVCSAWPYINTVPHLGTLIGSALSADVFARYLRLKGYDVVFVSGSDEHGTPIELEAIKRGVDVKSFCDTYHILVKELFEKFGISFDNYSRTHNPLHIEFCQKFFMKLYEKGFIFTEDVEQLYCIRCKRFLPDRFVEGVCPYCSYEKARGDQCDNCGKILDPIELINPVCSICGGQPILKSSKHWFFNLPSLTDKLKKWIESNTRLPPNARHFSLKLIEAGLKPRAVTRDNKWGIPAPFPGAENKTIYVWFEAVLGYITATIEWGHVIGNPNIWKEYWMTPETRSVYFIGKDNIPFHVIILPALLMAYDEKLVLPWTVSSTEYLTFEGRKFSKSLRIGVWLDQALKLLPPDYWRFYLIRIRPEKSDSNFSWLDFQECINNELNNDIGNFIHRVLVFVYNYFDGVVPSPEELQDEDNKILETIQTTTQEISIAMEEELSLKKALECVINLARRGNYYLNLKEPWHAIKKDISLAKTCIFVAAQIVASLSILLEPFIPFTAKELRSMMNLNLSNTNNNWGLVGTILLNPGHRINKPYPLFHKISKDEIINQLERINI